jgi:nitroreductase
MPDAPLSVPDAILRRRATSHFDTSRPLPDALLARILELATHAPSGWNLQPWRFLVVRSQANRDKLARCAFNQIKIAEAPAVVIVLGYHHPHRTHLEAMVDQQIALGAVTPEIGAGIRGAAYASVERRADRELWATRSAMLAAMTMMLAAESLGVSSAPMEGFDDEKLRAAFGIPDDHAVCCLVALGHGTESRAFPGRFGLSDIAYREHFGQPWAQ